MADRRTNGVARVAACNAEPSGLGAALTVTGQFDLVLDLLETVFGGDSTTPVSKGAVVNFYHRAAAATREMVVVSRTAGAISRLAIGAKDRIDLALVGQATEIAVDSRETDSGLGGAKLLVKFLGGQCAIPGR